MLDIIVNAAVFNDQLWHATENMVMSVRENTERPYHIHMLLTSGEYADSGEDITIHRDKVESLAEGNNLLIGRGTGDYICMTHTDVEFPPSWDASMTHPEKIMCVSVDEMDDPTTRGIQHTLKSFPTSCCCVFPRRIFEKVGPFDERFKPFHFEDTDWWYRALKEGVPIERAPVTVKHRKGLTASFSANKGTTALFINKKRFIMKWNIKSDEEYLDTLPAICGEIPEWKVA